MLLDITLKITPQMIKDAPGNKNPSLVGHLGTHFDVMNARYGREFRERDRGGACPDCRADRNLV